MAADMLAPFLSRHNIWYANSDWGNDLVHVSIKKNYPDEPILTCCPLEPLEGYFAKLRNGMQYPMEIFMNIWIGCH